MSSGRAEGPKYIPRYLPLDWLLSMLFHEREVKRDDSGVVRGEYGIKRVLCRFRCREEYWENLWTCSAKIGKVSLRFSTDKPMSPAKARSVEVGGRVLIKLPRRMSMHRTKSVGDMGQPWRTPEWSVIEGKSSDPSLR